MPDLNLAALNIASSNNTAPARAKDSGRVDESEAASFDKVMTQAATNPAQSQDDSKTVPAGPDTSHNARLPHPGVQKGKLAKTDQAQEKKGKEDAELIVNPQTAPAPSAERPADAASPAPGADTKGLEHAANVIATLAAAHPAATTVTQAAVPLPVTDNGAADGRPEADTPLTSIAGKSAARAPRGRPADTASAALPDRVPAAEVPAAAHAARESAQSRQTGRESAPKPATVEGNPPTPVRGAIDGQEIIAARGNQTEAQRDRLAEDFQQRFERSLTVAPSASAAASPGEAGLVQSAAAPAAAGVSLSAAANHVMQIALPAPVGTVAFTEDFSNRVTLLTRGRIQSAELSLTPPDLGPVNVSIEVHGTDATLVFSAPHAATRAAIEDAMPRLREMLDAQGLQLADARVGSQAGHDAARDGNRPQRPPMDATPAQIDAASASPVPLATVSVRSTRLIDVIA